MHTKVRFGCRLFAASAVITLTALFAAGAGSAQGSSRFQSVPVQAVSGSGVQALSNKPVMAIVRVSGAPVTVADAKANRTLTAGQKQQLKAQLKQQQAPIADRLRGLGAKVEASYQMVYNGLRVSVPRDQLARLSTIPNVVSVHVLRPIKLDNVHGVPLIGAPQVWGGVADLNGLAGEGIKIADIDTGIDYTHADFGGPGTTQAYQSALATDTAPADPAMFGPNAPRVKGGTDLVGDAYNASSSNPAKTLPHPDPNPLDCNGHGTHTAGTAAGSGVLSDGSTYTGPYDANTVSSHTWNVGPGVAPQADIYAVRVFGCAGSTNVVLDAIEWAVEHHMDVINMSLGSPYGSSSDPDAVASDNAAADGVIVVASAGNNGPNPYVDGSPATASGAISVAANDPTQSFPGVDIALASGSTLHGTDANGIPVNGLTAPIKVLKTSSGSISLGCDPNEYTAAGVAGDIVVVRRGTCARVARAIFGQEAGAAAVIMVNNVNSLPPYEGPITSNPDTGQQFTVTIPFLGVKSSDGAALLAADGTTATLTDTTLPNPGYLATASFSSGGPRSGDSALKPDVTAPGVSIASAGMGTGIAPAFMSGTSMAAPHTTGTAALVREAHPSWGLVKYWKAAIVNTADPALVADYRTRVNGVGLVQAQRAVATKAVALATDDTASLSFGYAELRGDYSKSQQVILRNFDSSPVTFTTGHQRDAGSTHSVAISTGSVTVPGNGTAKVSITLNVPAPTAGDSSAFHDVAGLITFTPSGGANNGVALAVPYYLVPQAASNVHTALSMTTLQKKHAATANISNIGGVVAGNADWYSWGVPDPQETGLGSNNIRAVGVQSFPNDGVLAFGLSTYSRWSNAAADEFVVYVDVNSDNSPDYVVVEADFGAVTTGTSDGRAGSFVFNLQTGSGSVEFLADAPFNSTSMALPAGLDQFCDSGSPCLSPSNPRISYYAVGFARDGSMDQTSSGTFNVFNPSLSTGMFDTVQPGQTVNQPVTLDPTEFGLTPSLGYMVLSHDNRNSGEAQLLGF
jgi:subtilisin family serine protease